MNDFDFRRPLKVALVSDFCLPRQGGIEYQLRDLGLQLTAAGHTVHLITSTPGPAEVAGLRVHRLATSHVPKLAVMWNPLAFAQVRALIARERYDVLHCHTALSPLANGTALLGRQLGIPSLLTEHSVLRDDWAPVFRAVRGLYRWPRWPHLLSGVSRVVAADLRRISGREDVVVLPNGVNLDEWRLSDVLLEQRRSQPSRSGRRRRVTSVMRFTPRKQPLDVVRAMAHVYAQLPESQRPLFTLVGDGPERERVVALAEQLGLTAELELPGFLPREEVRKILYDSELFILPTAKEALSIAAIEARCAGLPVVAMAGSGVSDVVASGRQGFLAGSGREFGEAIVRLLRDEPLRQRMAAEARAGIERFAWPQILHEHLEAYARTAAQCRAAAVGDAATARRAVIGS